MKIENQSKYDIINTNYLASAVSKESYPEEKLPQIAFIGRSNVGKSSLLNSLSNRHRLAYVSSSPGKTQTINFYGACLREKECKEERRNFYLVDLPGYGYAKVAKKTKRNWGKFIEEYLLDNQELRIVCLLIDARHSVMAIDREVFNWFLANKVPFLIVATKVDKIGKNELNANLTKIVQELNISKKEVFLFSALKKTGRQELLARIWQELEGN